MDAGEEMCKEEEADYYYEDHVDNVWSIIISVLNGGGGEAGIGLGAAVTTRKMQHSVRALIGSCWRQAVCMEGVERSKWGMRHVPAAGRREG